MRVTGQEPAVAGVVAIIRLREHQPADALLDALVAAGVDAIEVTLPTPGSLEAVRRWVAKTSMTVGVGTVRTPTEAARAIDAGAQFLVTPTTVPQVVESATARAVPTVCGALTPTEIDTAWQLGATAVKVFPVATAGGPAYVRSIQEPLDDVRLLPTGGVTVESTREYARLGCTGVGVGSALASEALVAGQQWTELSERAAEFVTAWEEGQKDRHR
ncbi:MAG: bifunctional 4-hydroxy-2-oxoglutarate aldolase/2-dehydro-3-deoxy-phosphogluconate aldolase [Nocardioidaceae bacterium]